MTITISYTQLRSGDWGVRLQGDADALTEYGEGDQVDVTKRDGNVRTETLDRLVWASEDGCTALYSVAGRQGRQAPRQARRTPAPAAPAQQPQQAAQAPQQAPAAEVRPTVATVALVRAACALVDDVGSEDRLAGLIAAVAAWRTEVAQAFAPAAPAQPAQQPATDVEQTIEF